MARTSKTFKIFNIKDASLLTDDKSVKDTEITVTNWDVKDFNNDDEIRNYIEYELNIAFGFGSYTFQYEEIK